MVSKINPGMMDGGTEIGDFLISARSSKTKCLLCDGAAYSRTTYAQLFAQVGTSFGAGDGSTTFNVPDPRGRALIFAGAGSLAESFAASAVTVATDLITVTVNVDRWITGMKVRATTTGTLPTGLAAATDYFVIRASTTTIKLAATLANAVAGVAIDITGQGSGTHTLTHTMTARTVGDKGGEEAHASTVAEMPAHGHTTPMSVYYERGGSGQGTLGNLAYNIDRDPVTVSAAGGSGAHNNMPPFLVVGNLFIYAGV